jgi:hypothetical protein
MMSDLHSTGVVIGVGDFKLDQQDLISGEPIFYLPKRNGVVCALPDCDILEAYNYCFSPTPLRGIKVLPCTVDEWDRLAVCLFRGQLGSAVAAFDFGGADLEVNRLGWFSRWEAQDLRWEITVS